MTMARMVAGRLLVIVVSTWLSIHIGTALADCRAEVEAAFQMLQMPGRAYRRVTTMTSAVHVADSRGLQVRGETAEFILPDRKRRIVDYVGDQPSSEWIRVGERTWMREGQQWLEGYVWMDNDIFLSGVWSHRMSFECLAKSCSRVKLMPVMRQMTPRPPGSLWDWVSPAQSSAARS